MLNTYVELQIYFFITLQNMMSENNNFRFDFTQFIQLKENRDFTFPPVRMCKLHLYKITQSLQQVRDNRHLLIKQG